MTYRLEVLEVDGEQCALLVTEQDGCISRAAAFKIQPPPARETAKKSFLDGFWPKNWRAQS